MSSVSRSLGSEPSGRPSQWRPMGLRWWLLSHVGAGVVSGCWSVLNNGSVRRQSMRFVCSHLGTATRFLLATLRFLYERTGILFIAS